MTLRERWQSKTIGRENEAPPIAGDPLLLRVTHSRAEKGLMLCSMHIEQRGVQAGARHASVGVHKPSPPPGAQYNAPAGLHAGPSFIVVVGGGGVLRGRGGSPRPRQLQILSRAVTRRHRAAETASGGLHCLKSLGEMPNGGLRQPAGKGAGKAARGESGFMRTDVSRA